MNHPHISNPGATSEASSAAPSPEPDSAKPRRKKGPFRSGLLTLIVVVALLLFLCGEFFCDGLIAWVLSTTVATTTGARVEIQKSDVSILTAGVTLRDVDLFPYFATDEALFHGRRATARLDLGAALSGRAWIPELSLVGGVITLRRDAQGHLNIDPGPPPDDAAPDAEAPPERPPADHPDMIQQVAELIDRLQRYQGYYDKLRQEKREQAAEEASRERVYPGAASYLPTRREEAQPRLWIQRIEARDLRLVTHDARTGKPFLPIDSISLRVENLTEDTALTGKPVRCEIEAETRESGHWTIRYASADPHSAAGATRLGFALLAVPFDAVASLVDQSLPFSLQGGTLALETVARKAALAGRPDAPGGPLKIVDGRVRGAVRLRLAELRLTAGPGSEKVLGLPGSTFAELFNHAVGETPLDLLFSVDGRLGRPRISLLNGGELLETLKQRALGAAEERLRGLAREVTAEVEAEVTRRMDEARALSGDSLDAATEAIDEQIGGALRSTPLGKKVLPEGEQVQERSGEAIDKAAGKVNKLLDRGKGSLGGLLGGDDAGKDGDRPPAGKKKGPANPGKTRKGTRKKDKGAGSGSGAPSGSDRPVPDSGGS